MVRHAASIWGRLHRGGYRPLTPTASAAPGRVQQPILIPDELRPPELSVFCCCLRGKCPAVAHIAGQPRERKVLNGAVQLIACELYVAALQRAARFRGGTFCGARQRSV